MTKRKRVHSKTQIAKEKRLVTKDPELGSNGNLEEFGQAAPEGARKQSSHANKLKKSNNLRQDECKDTAQEEHKSELLCTEEQEENVQKKNQNVEEIKLEQESDGNLEDLPQEAPEGVRRDRRKNVNKRKHNGLRQKESDGSGQDNKNSSGPVEEEKNVQKKNENVEEIKLEQRSDRNLEELIQEAPEGVRRERRKKIIKWKLNGLQQKETDGSGQENRNSSGPVEEEKDVELYQLLQEFNHAEDPGSVDRVQERLERIEEEGNKYMMRLLESCSTMSVDWLRPWYQRHDQGVTRTLREEDPTNPQQYRTDSFTQEEDDIIEENWKLFTEKFQVPNRPQCFARWRNNSQNKKATSPMEMLRSFVSAYLARGLQRTVSQVYKHFVVKYGQPVRGAYSAAEEKIMAECFSLFGEKSVIMLAKVLSRDSRGIYYRYNDYISGKPESKRIAKWTLKMAGKLINSIMSHAKCSVEALEGMAISKDVWVEVERDMEIPYNILKKMWYCKLHVQLFARTEIRLSQLKRKIYRVLKKSPYKRWKDIRWLEVVKKFPPGITAAFLHKITSRLVRSYCPKYIHLSLPEVLQMWSEKSLKIYAQNRRLKLVRLNTEGKLEFYKVVTNEL